MSGEPEQIKAFRDTWELGIHSYLTYLRDRLLVAKELLTESGSIFLQISAENVHLVRSLLDEVFGSENHFVTITYRTSSPLGASGLPSVCDYILWYAKKKDQVKFRPLFQQKDLGEGTEYTWVEEKNGLRRKMTSEEKNRPQLVPNGSKIFARGALFSSGFTASCIYDFKFEGITYSTKSKSWRTNKDGMDRLIKKGRLIRIGELPYFVQYHNDFPLQPLNNLWYDTRAALDKRYVVETSFMIIQRCLLMSTDPGDLAFDPTCGSGTTAYVCEQWGRRWITTDTSRIALNIAKTRITTANFPYYKLHDDRNGDVRQGFVYKRIPHITLKSLAQDEPSDEENLYDQPEVDGKKMRVAGPFTVETLQNFNPLSPEETDSKYNHDEDFEERIFNHLRSAGIKNGIKNENAVFTRIDQLNSEYIHAVGYYPGAKGEKMAYLHIGPKFGSVSKQAVSAAIKECRQRGDADWLVILGFSFESDIQNQNVTSSMGGFEVTKVRMHDDLMQEGLLKKDKKAASFVTIGEPDIKLEEIKEKGSKEKKVQVSIQGLDIYDPIKDEVKARDVHDIAYWMVDDDYDGSNFVVKQVFFCGGDQDEFDKWKKGLSDLSESRNKRRQQLQSTLKIEIDEEAFERLYGHSSHPIAYKKGRKIAVRVISQFGEESTKVLVM